jgi:hypothetical protein
LVGLLCHQNPRCKIWVTDFADAIDKLTHLSVHQKADLIKVPQDNIFWGNSSHLLTQKGSHQLWHPVFKPHIHILIQCLVLT